MRQETFFCFGPELVARAIPASSPAEAASLFLEDLRAWRPTLSGVVTVLDLAGRTVLRVPF